MRNRFRKLQVLLRKMLSSVRYIEPVNGCMGDFFSDTPILPFILCSDSGSAKIVNATESLPRFIGGAPEGPKEFTLNRMSIIPKLYDELGSRSIILVDPFKLRAGLKYNPEKGATRYILLTPACNRQEFNRCDDY
ncbi:MAG: hypothetical protein QME64_08760 [bacterium]|nr:hypothetical protein [bacterium]